MGHNTLVFSGILIPGKVAKKYTKKCVFTDPFFFFLGKQFVSVAMSKIHTDKAFHVTFFF